MDVGRWLLGGLSLAAEVCLGLIHLRCDSSSLPLTTDTSRRHHPPLFSSPLIPRATPPTGIFAHAKSCVAQAIIIV